MSQHTSNVALKPTGLGADASLDAVWNKVRELAGSRPSTKAMVGGLSLQSMADGQVTLTSDDRDHLNFARAKSELIASLFKQAVGKAVEVSFDRPAVADIPQAVRDNPATQHPVVQKAIELLDASVVSIEPEEPVA